MVKKKKADQLNRIKEVAEEKGKTQVWIANKMGLHIMTVSGWYRNIKQPHLSDLKKLAKLLEVNMCDLLNIPEN